MKKALAPKREFPNIWRIRFNCVCYSSDLPIGSHSWKRVFIPSKKKRAFLPPKQMLPEHLREYLSRESVIALTCWQAFHGDESSNSSVTALKFRFYRFGFWAHQLFIENSKHFFSHWKKNSQPEAGQVVCQFELLNTDCVWFHLVLSWSVFVFLYHPTKKEYLSIYQVSHAACLSPVMQIWLNLPDLLLISATLAIECLYSFKMNAVPALKMEMGQVAHLFELWCTEFTFDLG